MRKTIIADIAKQGRDYWSYVMSDNPIPGLNREMQRKIQAFSAEYYAVARELMGIREEDYNV